MACNSLRVQIGDECLASDLATLDDGISLHHISAIVGHSVVKVSNVDSQGIPMLKFKDIDSCYGSARIKREEANFLDKRNRKKDWFGGITVKLEMESPEKVPSPFKSNENFKSMRKNSRCIRKLLNMENFDDCEEVTDCLTLSELRLQCKAKRQKILKSSTSTQPDINNTSLSGEPQDEGHHSTLSEPSETQADLDVPLIILKRKLSRKASQLINGKRDAQSFLSNVVATRKPSSSSISSGSSNSMHNTSDAVDRASVNDKMTMGCLQSMQCAANQSFQNFNEISDERSNTIANMDPLRKFLKDPQKVDCEAGATIPSVENFQYFYEHDNPALSEYTEQSMLVVKSEVSMDENNTNSPSLSESEVHSHNFNNVDLPYKGKTDDLQHSSSDKHNSLDIVACPTFDSISDFCIPCEQLADEIPLDQQKTVYISDDFLCYFSRELQLPNKFSEGALEVIGNVTLQDLGCDGITSKATPAEMLKMLPPEQFSQPIIGNLQNSLRMDILPVVDHISFSSSASEFKYGTPFNMGFKSIYKPASIVCLKAYTNDNYAIQLEDTICWNSADAANQKIYLATCLDDTKGCGGSSGSGSIMENKHPQITDLTNLNIGGSIRNIKFNKFSADCSLMAEENEMKFYDDPVTEVNSSPCSRNFHQVNADLPSADVNSLSFENTCLALSEDASLNGSMAHAKTESSKEKCEDGKVWKACPNQSSCTKIDTVADLDSNVSSRKHNTAEVGSDANCSADVPSFINEDEEEEKQASNCYEVMELKQPPKKLLSNRKSLSPSSREKLCHTIDAKKLYESSRKRPLCEKFANNLSLLSGQREPKFMASPERMLKKARNDTHPPTKGSPLSPFASCRKSSMKSSLTSSDAQDAINFSHRQMHDIGIVTGKLVSWVRSMRGILAEVLSSETHLSSLEHKDKLRTATEDAPVLESMTKRYMAMMTRDHKRFCKIMRLKEHKMPVRSNNAPKKKAITFADEAGGLLCHVKPFEKSDTVVVSEGYADNS